MMTSSPFSEPAPGAQTEVLAFLESGAAFGLKSPPRRIDTHAAVVFLCPDRAWKLKRAVRLPYLDFSTPALRGIALEAELSLNRRTAPTLYRAVHPIRRGKTGRLSIGGTGETIDWLLEMTRFPDGALLDEMAAGGQIDDALLLRLADRVQRFHATEPIVRTGTAADDFRTVVEAALDRLGTLAPGIRYELGGLYQQQQIAFAGLLKVFGAALIAEFALLLILYRRFWLPVIIIGCSLLSTTAVFTALWASGVDLNITALMGMTMIIGIGTEMAIFYVSEFEDLARHMPPAEAARAASRNRLRPITMTTLAAIFTLLPLALAIGQGSGIQQPLAIAIIAGLLLQYPLVLLAMPVLLRLTTERRAT